MTSKTIIAKGFVHVGGGADTSSGSVWQSKGSCERVLVRTERAGATRQAFGALNKRLQGEAFAKGNSAGKVEVSTE
jgi:hypothetical protein